MTRKKRTRMKSLSIGSHSSPGFTHSKTKKGRCLIATSSICALPLELRSLSSQERDLTTKIYDRYRGTAVSDVADILSSILCLEVIIPKVIQRDLSCRRSSLESEGGVTRNTNRYVALV